MTFDIMLPSPCESQGHRNLISALHKFLRGSDPDAGLYWSVRMVAGGEDARYVARRLVRFASEDVGMADPGALPQALAAAKATGSLPPPSHILNAPTRLMRDLGHGKGYAYDHDAEGAFFGQNYFSDGMDREAFYRPADRGFEREVARRLDHWAKLRQDRA